MATLEIFVKRLPKKRERVEAKLENRFSFNSPCSPSPKEAHMILLGMLAILQKGWSGKDLPITSLNFIQRLQVKKFI